MNCLAGSVTYIACLATEIGLGGVGIFVCASTKKELLNLCVTVDQLY
jgi:hypothetical protein